MPAPLLLVHGFTDTAHTWDSLRVYLDDRFEVIAPTLLGHHGGGPLPPDMSDPLAAMADDLEARLDDAGIDKVAVVGNSLGGWLAFVLAARGRASRVLALSPAQGWPSDAPPASTRRQFARAHRTAPLGARYARRIVSRAVLRRVAFAELIAHPERVAPSTAATLIRGAADCPMFEPYIDFTEANDYRAGFADLGVPTVIAWGERDRTIPLETCSGWFRGALPDAEWIDLPGCGHLPQHDDPELVAALITRLMS